jgi:hypothetical protein
MTRKEIEKKKKDLTDILKEGDAGVRLGKLQKLAKEVGASVTRMETVAVSQSQNLDGRITYGNPSNKITETEIVHNIQVALQVETMIDMCKTAARNFWIAVGAMLIALFAMLATWLGVAVNWWSGR